MATHPDLLIVGGGIIGLTTAYFAAKAGMGVAVYDRGDLGREASWAGAGILPPGDPERAATPVDRLRAIGSRQMPAFAAELRELTGIDNGYRRCGGIEFLAPHDADVPPLWEGEGIAFERVTGARLNALEPAVVPIDEAYLLPDCAQVRNPWHLRALIAACERVGVSLHPHAAVDGWERAGGRVSGVRLAVGEVARAGHVLLAAGAWSEEFLGLLGHRPGVHPIRGQIALLNVKRATFERVLMAGKRYLVPRGDGRVLVGSTEEPEAGFERATTAAGVAGLLAFAARLVPYLAEAEVVTCWAGLRPGTPDGLPFIGPVPGFDNVFVAAGHGRAGIQLSLGTARVMVDVIRGQKPCVPIDGFCLDRTPDTTTRPSFRS